MRVHEGWHAVMRPWLAVLDAFLTLPCILFKLKHSCNSHQTFILESKMSPVTIDRLRNRQHFLKNPK
jgi:hypothetical protein